jgi:hypothetical protein
LFFLPFYLIGKLLDLREKKKKRQESHDKVNSS